MTVYSLTRLIILFCLLVSNVACTGLTREIEQVDKQNAQLTTDVKSALIDDNDVDAAAILVTVREDGSIALSGFVGTDRERQAALNATRDAAPGISVIDQLELR